jgi:signal transduction histidine kinase
MITLKQWYRNNTQFPVLWTALSIALVAGFYFFYLIYDDISERQESIESIVRIINLSMTQSNQVLLDAFLAETSKALQVNTILVCRDDRPRIAYPYHYGENCRELEQRHWFWSLWDMDIKPTTGNPYRFYFNLKLFSPEEAIRLVGLITYLAVVIIYIIFRVEYRLKTQIIVPLLQGINSDEPMEITELEQIRQKNRRFFEMQSKEQLARLAAQTSHDIKSPLTALNKVISDIAPSLDERQRVMVRTQIQRIKDIANSLLARAKSNAGDREETDALSPQLLSSSIEEIITEKRQAYRDFLNLNIEANLDNSYGLFAEINLSQFKRVLSNLINNGVEAYDDRSGTVSVTLLEENELIKIIVEDFGKGIPPEVVDRIGQEGVSFGKEGDRESGSGIGLHHAVTTVQSFGGELAVRSTMGEGTRIILTLPKTTPPYWFLPSLSFPAGSVIVVLDDDSGIHDIWDDRFQKAGIPEHRITVVHLSNPGDFDHWITLHRDQAAVTYLCDYELINHRRSGLDLIEQYRLKNAVLVSSRYEEEAIRKRCDDLGVRLIPKMLAGLVPLSVAEKTEESSEWYYDAVFIEDNDVIRQSWERDAKKHGIKLLPLSSIKAFSFHKDRIDKETTDIYIDNHLGRGEPKGEDFAKELHDGGYRNLYIASSFPPERFKELTFLKGISGKNPFGRTG